MAIAFVQRVGTGSGHPTGGSTTATCTLSATPGAGHLLVLGYMGAQFGISSISDPKGNTWTVQRTTSGRSVAWTLQDVATLASGDAVTMTLAGTNFRYESMIDEFSGVLSPSPVDASAISSFTSGTSRVYGAVTTTVTGALIYAMDGISGNETSYTAGGSYTALAIFTDGTLSVEGEYTVTSTVGSVTPPAATGAVTTTGASITVAFKAATGTTQTITAVGGIASSEAFGPVTRIRSPQFVFAAAIRSLETFGSGDAYGTAQYGTAKYGSGSAATLTASVTTRQTIYASGIASTGAVGIPVLRVMGQLTTIRPPGIASAEAVGRPSFFAVDRSASAFGGVVLGDALIFTAATVDQDTYDAAVADSLVFAGAVEDVPVNGGRLSDILVEIGGLDDTPGH